MAEVTPTETNLPQLPFPLYQMVHIGMLSSREGDTFSVFLGANEDVAARLKQKSLDTSDADIQDNTSDRKRFGEGSYEEWYAKERTPFALIHEESGDLAAFAWFGPKPLGRKPLKYLSEDELQKEASQKKDEWHTISYRSYPPYRGKGVMSPFIRFAIETYRKLQPGIHLWAGIDAANPASVGLITKLGFTREKNVSDNERQVFVLQ